VHLLVSELRSVEQIHFVLAAQISSIGINCALLNRQHCLDLFESFTFAWLFIGLFLSVFKLSIYAIV